MNRSLFLSLAAFRIRSSDWDMPARLCVLCMYCCSAFPLSDLRSPNSATGRPALFVGFTATILGIRWGERQGYGILGDVVKPPHKEALMSQAFEASWSLAALDQNGTPVAVIDMGQTNWLVTAVIPGAERPPLKKIDADGGCW